MPLKISRYTCTTYFQIGHVAHC